MPAPKLQGCTAEEPQGVLAKKKTTTWTAGLSVVCACSLKMNKLLVVKKQKCCWTETDDEK